MRRARKQKNIIIGIVMLALFVMTAGYAAYQKRLDISGVANIDYKDWNIRILSIENVESSSGVDVVEPSHTNTTAKFNSKITKVGGYIKYKIVVKNSGTIDGVLGAINIEESSNSVITYTVSGVDVDDELKVGEEATIYVTATYDESKVDTATTNTSNVSVNLTYVQLEGYINQNKAEFGDTSVPIVDENEGLYDNMYEEGTYFYRGTNPDNYIQFNNELWRIISISPNNYIKIIRNESIGSMPYDVAGARVGTSTFCFENSNGSGCSAWAKTSSLIGSPAEFTIWWPNGNKDTDTSSVSGTVVDDSTLNTYLNSTYYNSITEKEYMIEGIFNVGSPGNYYDTEDFETNVAQTREFQWKGYVGLIDAMEYVQSDSTNENADIDLAFDSEYETTLQSWLKVDGLSYWTITPSACRASLCNYGNMLIGTGDNVTSTSHDIRPVVYLNSNIKLEGTGTIDDYYRIVN